MPRLRTTTSLSLFALLIGVAGTAWLSDMTAGRAELPMRHLAVAAHGVTHPRAHLRHSAVLPRRHEQVPISPAVATSAPSHDEVVTLVPISMPSASLPFSRMRHHDAGRLILHVVVNGSGDVTSATVAQSSGDGILDANAVAIAQRWRFAVPADHPQGISGDLPMRFTATSALSAQTL